MSTATKGIEPWLREIIRCPKCKGALDDTVSADTGDAVVELTCPTCGLAYPVEGSVPVLLVDLARRTDG